MRLGMVIFCLSFVALQSLTCEMVKAYEPVSTFLLLKAQDMRCQLQIKNTQL